MEIFKTKTLAISVTYSTTISSTSATVSGNGCSAKIATQNQYKIEENVKQAE